jgi:hypothetical protein
MAFFNAKSIGIGKGKIKGKAVWTDDFGAHFHTGETILLVLLIP